MTDLFRHCWQSPNSTNQSRAGYTLIELLVVVLIIGILAAIALPTLLGQVNKAREIEAIQTIRQLNEGQKAFYLEKSQFTESLSDLGISVNHTPPASSCILGRLGIPHQQTQNYCYGVKPLSPQNTVVFHIALSEKANFASYVGVVYLENANLISCGPIKVAGCSSASLTKCVDLLFKAKANPVVVCSNFK